MSDKFCQQCGCCQGRGIAREAVLLDFSLASQTLEASEQLSAQAVGSRCRAASPSCQLSGGKMAVHSAALVAISDGQSLFLLALALALHSQQSPSSSLQGV